MIDRVQTLRYATSLQRPPTSERPGELSVNFADLQISVLDQSRDPIDLVSIRFYSSAAIYSTGDHVLYSGVLYKALVNMAAGPFNPANWVAYANMNDLFAQIQIEANARIAEDGVLASKIDAEILNRLAADNALEAQINNILSTLASLIPSGLSVDYWGMSAPSGWLIEDGAVYSMTTYPALGALLGPTFGGDGTTTFAVPDSRGKFSLAASSSHPLYSSGGVDAVTIDVSNLPPHTHAASQTAHTHTPTDPNFVGLDAGAAPTGFAAGASSPPAATLNLNSVTPTITVSPTGGGLPLSILPPYMVRTRIIKT